MKKWILLLFVIAICGCLEESDTISSTESFDTDPSAAFHECDGCHSSMPPNIAPHDADHNFFSCNYNKCHGNLVNAEGTMASRTDPTHSNGTSDASCAACHKEGTVFTDTNSNNKDSDDTDADNTEPNDTEPDDTEPIDTDSNDTDPNDTEPDDTGSDTVQLGCNSCHNTPPSGVPHDDVSHRNYSCNDKDCHGNMVDADGTQVLDDSKHMDGISQTPGAVCGPCH